MWTRLLCKFFKFTTNYEVGWNLFYRFTMPRGGLLLANPYTRQYSQSWSTTWIYVLPSIASLELYLALLLLPSPCFIKYSWLHLICQIPISIIMMSSATSIKITDLGTVKLWDTNAAESRKLEVELLKSWMTEDQGQTKLPFCSPHWQAISFQWFLLHQTNWVVFSNICIQSESVGSNITYFFFSYASTNPYRGDNWDASVTRYGTRRNSMLTREKRASLVLAGEFWSPRAGFMNHIYWDSDTSESLKPYHTCILKLIALLLLLISLPWHLRWIVKAVFNLLYWSVSAIYRDINRHLW